jgi:microcystin-dependent protein
MSTPFLTEIRIMSFNFAPKGWTMCNGQLLPINQNQAIFALLGTTYGGDGRVNFGLPDLRSRIPISMGSGHTLGERGGSESVTINISTMPGHIHAFAAQSTDATQGPAGRTPTTASVAKASAAPLPATPVNVFGTGTPTTQFDPSAITNVGGSQPHQNIEPYLALNFCIALQGIFPSQN